MKKLIYLGLIALASCGPKVIPDYKPTTTVVPGQDLLGKTYNIFTGEYADNKSTITEILNFNEAQTKTINYQGYDFNMPDILEYTNIAKSKNDIIVGESINDFSESFNVSTGLGVNGLVFSGSVKVDLLNSRNENTYNYYSQNYYIVENHKLSIKDAGNVANRSRFIENLNPYVSKNFIEDINGSSSPETIFKSYGTHFLAEIILGAKIDQNIRIESLTKKNASSIQTDVQAKYKIVKGNFSIGKTETAEVKETKYITKFDARGGDIALLGTDTTKEKNFNYWSKSVKNNPVLVDFTNNSLIPIWEFANEEFRKKQLKDYFYDVLAKQYPKVDVVENKPKPETEFKRNNPVAEFVDGNMKGVKKGSIFSIGADYDNTEVALRSFNNNNNDRISYSYWYFYNAEEAKKNFGKKYYKSGNTTKSKYDDVVNDRFTIYNPAINENGEFYLEAYLKNDNFSGATGNNSVEFGKWIKSDNPISVKDVNNKKEVRVTFFDEDLEFKLQF